jgi:hypothetical protein
MRACGAISLLLSINFLEGREIKKRGEEGKAREGERKYLQEWSER